MIKLKYMLLFFLFVFLTLNLNGGFWIKALYTDDGQLIYEKNSGYFFSFAWNYGIFDITGRVYMNGGFQKTDSTQMPLSKTIRLDDETFFGFGRRHEWDPTENSWVRVSLHILRFNQDGEVLFSKEFNEDEDFDITDILILDNKIKVVGRYEDKNNKKHIVILTLSENGNLEKSKMLFCEGNHYNLDFWHSNCVKIDADHYGIVVNGNFEENQYQWYNGILFIKLNRDDDITRAIYYFDQKGGCWYFDQKIKKDADSGFSILVQGDYWDEDDISTRWRLFLLKLDNDWNLKWSKEYTLRWNYAPVDFFEDQNGYTIGLRTKHEINGEELDKPVLLKIDHNGKPVWCKKYSVNDSCTEYLQGITGLPNGGMVMSNWGGIGDSYYGGYIYILNKDGEVPGGYYTPKNLTVEGNNKKFHEETIRNKNFKFSDFNLLMEDIDARYIRYDIGNSVRETFCEYLNIDGDVTIIKERSLFGGYYIHKINFYADLMILPYINKFKIYRRSTGDYDFISDIAKVEGKTDYEVTFESIFSEISDYKIVAVNSADEVVDIAVLREQN